jgi:hypothetical protein
VYQLLNWLIDPVSLDRPAFKWHTRAWAPVDAVVQPQAQKRIKSAQKPQKKRQKTSIAEEDKQVRSAVPVFPATAAPIPLVDAPPVSQNATAPSKKKATTARKTRTPGATVRPKKASKNATGTTAAGQADSERIAAENEAIYRFIMADNVQATK